MSSSKQLFFGTSVFLMSIVLHGFLVFTVLPRTQLVKYPKTAENYLQHKIVGERLLDFSPLYLQLHVLGRRFFSNPTSTIQWIHLILTASASGLFFAILIRFFPLSIALAGTITFILDRSIIIYTQAFEPEPLMMFLLIAFLFFVIQVSYWNHLAAGIVLGFAIWTRPNFLPLLLVIPIYFYFRHSNRSTFIRSTILCCLPILIALFGLWIRNATVVGYFSPIVMNPGTALFEGNNPVSEGFSSIYPPLVDDVSSLHGGEVDYHHVVYREFARKITNKNLTVPEVNKFWISKATNFLIDHPQHAFRLLATKVFHFFHQFQWHDIANAFWNEQLLKKSHIPTVPFGFVSAMALFGMWVGKRRWKGFLILYGMFLAQFLFMMAIYVSARQRASILSLFIFFACAGVHFLLEKRSWVRSFAFILPLTLLLSFQTDAMDEEIHLWQNIRSSQSWQTESYQQRRGDKLKASSEAAARALAATPFNLDFCRPANLSFEPKTFPIAARTLITPINFSSQFDRAVLSLEGKHSRDSQQDLNEIISSKWSLKRDYYQSSEPHYYLGRASVIDGNIEAAVRNLHLALDHAPGDPWTLASLFILTKDEKYRRQLFRYFDEIDAHFFLGEAGIEFGNPQEAVENLKYVTDLLPDYRRAWVYLAAAYSNANRLEEGAETYKHALKLSPDPVLLEEEILSLYERLAERYPQDPEKLYMAGFVFRQFGHYKRALEFQKLALKFKDSNAIRSEIAVLEKAIGSIS